MRRLVHRREDGELGVEARRDLWVGIPLAADPAGGGVVDGRLYLPAIGAIALLGAWLVTWLPERDSLRGPASVAVIAALFGVGVWAFYAMYAAIGVPLHG